MNIYATVASLGIMDRLGCLQLPVGLSALSSTWIIYPSVALFLIEVFADRIPFFGLAWNMGHLFIRAPLAALIAYHAITPLSPELQLGVAVLSGAIAAVAHSSKAATRMLAAEGGVYVPSIALNGSGDAIAVGLVWLASSHPFISAAAVLVFLLLSFLCARASYRAIRHEIATVRLRWSGWWASRHAHP